jgi:hypothetical protein
VGGPAGLIREKMASISQQAEKLFQLNRNFEAEIEEVKPSYVF